MQFPACFINFLNFKTIHIKKSIFFSKKNSLATRSFFCRVYFYSKYIYPCITKNRNTFFAPFRPSKSSNVDATQILPFFMKNWPILGPKKGGNSKKIIFFQHFLLKKCILFILVSSQIFLGAFFTLYYL